MQTSRRLPGPVTFLVAVCWALGLVVLDHAGLLQVVEGPLVDALERRVADEDPSGTVWCLDISEPALAWHGHLSAADLWKKILHAARRDRVRRIVELDLAHREHLRPVVDAQPSHEMIPVLSPVLWSDVGEEGAGGPVMTFFPDRDGVWRRDRFTTEISGRTYPTLSAFLAPPGLQHGRNDFELAFPGPVGVFPTAAGWRFVDGDVARAGNAPWRGATLVVYRNDGSHDSVIRTPYGQEISVPHAVAQLAECLESERILRPLQSEFTAIAIGLCFLFAAVMGRSGRPVVGFLVVFATAGAVVLTVLILRLSALWALPISPFIPTFAIGYAVGLGQKQHTILRGLESLLVGLGRRPTGPTLEANAPVEEALRPLAETLGVFGAALLDLDRKEPVMAWAARGGLTERFTLAPEHVQLIRDAAAQGSGPVFPSRFAGDLGLVVTPLPPPARAGVRLVLSPEDFASEWWNGNREMVESTLSSLARITEVRADQDRAGAWQSPEEVLRGLARRFTRAHTDLDRLSQCHLQSTEGVLVCDLLGRELFRNDALTSALGSLNRGSFDSLSSLLAQLDLGADAARVATRMRSVMAGGGAWEFLTGVRRPMEGLFRVKLEMLQLDPTAEAGGPGFGVFLLHLTELDCVMATDPLILARVLGDTVMIRHQKSRSRG